MDWLQIVKLKYKNSKTMLNLFWPNNVENVVQEQLEDILNLSELELDLNLEFNWDEEEEEALKD